MQFLTMHVHSTPQSSNTLTVHYKHSDPGLAGKIHLGRLKSCKAEYHRCQRYGPQNQMVCVHGCTITLFAGSIYMLEYVGLALRNSY